MIKGRSDDQKRVLVKNMTKVICESIGTSPEKVKIVISEISPSDYAVGGILKIDEQK
jgi:4-oxalocrotonate tautomerase